VVFLQEMAEYIRVEVNNIESVSLTGSGLTIQAVSFPFPWPENKSSSNPRLDAHPCLGIRLRAHGRLPYLAGPRLLARLFF
jgi:hypothetical protein